MILDKTVLTVPKGNSIVYTVVDPVKSPRLVLKCFSGGNKIGARIIERADFSSTNTQRFGIVVNSKAARKAQVQTVLVSGTAKHIRSVVAKSVAPAGLIGPWLGDPMKPGQWALARRPSATRPVWVDRHFQQTGQWHDVLHAFYCLGRVCGVSFRHAAAGNAVVRFHSRPRAEVDRLSRAWNAQTWFGTTAYGSAYIAIHPNRRDIYIGDRQKAAVGGGPLSPTNTTRFILNTYLQTLGWGVYHDDLAWPWAAANANFSAPIQFPNNNHGDCNGGLAGMDRYEVRKLQAQFGVPWLRRFG